MKMFLIALLLAFAQEPAERFVLSGRLFAQEPPASKAADVILPSEGKAVGVVKSDEAGKWIVLAQAGFQPINPTVLEAGKVCVFEAIPGTYAVIKIPPGDAQPVVYQVVLGLAPQPPPGPGPGPIPPVNPPVDPPLPLSGMRVLILYESEPRPATPDARKKLMAQVDAMNSVVLREYINSKVIKDTATGTPECRLVDQHATLTNLSKAWQDLRTAAKPTEIPWVVIEGSSGVAFSGPFPADLNSALVFFKKYGG